MIFLNLSGPDERRAIGLRFDVGISIAFCLPECRRNAGIETVCAPALTACSLHRIIT